MFKQVMAALLALAALFALAVPAKAAKPNGTEFKDGWNTYATAKVGDWVEYQISDTNVKRIEVKTVNGETIQTTETNIASGKAGDPVEKKAKEWWQLYIPAKVPTNMQVTWTTEDVKLGEVTLKCDVASWMNGTLSNDLYMCKDVRCGGYVKMLMGGKASVWLKNYGDKDHKEGYLKQVDDPNAGKGPALPGFYSQPGNTAVFKTKGAEGEKFTLRETENFDGTTTTFTDTPCDKDGKPVADAKAVETKLSNDDWAKLYAKPSATGEKVKVTAGEFSCSLFESTEGTKTKKEWITPEGLVAKSELKDGDKLTTTELISMKLK